MLLYNNKLVEFGKFPNGEVNLRKIEFSDRLVRRVVTLKYEGDEDLFHLLLLKKALGETPAILRITYVPYSRMDRDSDTYVFSLKVFADFINAMNWPMVVIYEPHSDVLPALLDRVQVVNVTTTLLKDYVAIKNYQVCYPDVGAFKRYSEQVKTGNALVGFKSRDFETGRILALNISGKKQSNDVIIIDDLCSKGGTFVLAAQKLREIGFKRVHLVVTHCENTIYKGQVFYNLDTVITTDSIIDKVTQDTIDYSFKNKLVVIPLTEFKYD